MTVNKIVGVQAFYASRLRARSLLCSLSCVKGQFDSFIKSHFKFILRKLKPRPYGKKCKKCNGMNHFANVCQGGGFRKSSKPVHTLRSEAVIEGTGEDGQLFVGTLFIGDIQANDWQTELWVNDTSVTFKLVTGAQANVLPVNVYRRIKPNKPLARTRTVLTAFGDAKITPVGETQLRVTGRGQLMKFFVTDTADIAILGKDACQSTNLVQRVRIDGVASHDSKPLTKEDLLTEYRDIFTGTGMFEKEHHEAEAGEQV